MPGLLAHGIFTAGLVVQLDARTDVSLVIFVIEFVIISFEARLVIMLLVPLLSYKGVLVLEKVVQLGMDSIFIRLVPTITIVLVVQVLSHDLAWHLLLKTT